MRSSHQMQQFVRSWPIGRSSATSMLLGAGAAVGLSQFFFALLDRGASADEIGMLKSFLSLSVDGIRQGRIFEFVTCSLFHAGPGPWHLLANMTLLFLAGREVEPLIGRRHFLALCAASFLIGGFFQWGVMVLGFAPAVAPVVGFSAGVAGTVGAYATILPEWETPLLLFGGQPQMRLKFFGFALVTFALVLWAGGIAPAIGPAGIFMGTIVGWAYMKLLGFGNPLAIQRYLFEKRQRRARRERMPAGQFICVEIDPILEKISREGMQSLTRSERRLLEQCRAKIEAKEAAVP